MTLPAGPERDFDQAKLLLEEYCFDLSGFQAGQLVAIWQERLEAEPSWIRAAVLEALYQGRYKAFSVEQILQGWKRRGHPVRHFNSEFERVVFGPIDPTISKYAAMTMQSPSELMSAQPETAKPPSSHTANNRPSAAGPSLPNTSSVSRDSAGAASPAPELPFEQATSDETTVTEPPLNAEPPAQPPPARSDDAEPQLSFESLLNAGTSQHSAVFSQPEPIRKFVPRSEASEFYQRLQSVVKHSQ